MIPTGEIADTANTPFDFSSPKAIKTGLESNNDQIKIAGGYDHCLTFGNKVQNSLKHAITLTDPASGRSMTVKTNMPAVQLYSGNFLDGSQSGRDGVIAHQTGLCIETQHYPDAMNHPHFPSAMLLPEDTYRHLIEYTLL